MIDSPAAEDSAISFWANLLLCAVVGVALAILPHLWAFHTNGSAQFIVDNDDILYLAIARAPYWGSWTLRDPFAANWQHLSTPFAGALFVPLAKVTRLLGLSPLMIALVWRVVGGALLGASLFVLVRRCLAFVEPSRRRTVLVSAVTLLLLADAGFSEGQPILGTLKLAKLLIGSGPMVAQSALTHFRIVTPLLDLPWLLFVMAALIPMRESKTEKIRWRFIAGTVCFAICVYTYFYYWTAAAMAIGFIFVGRLIAARFNPSARSRHLAEAKLAAGILLVGLFLGAPQVIGNAHLASQPQFAQALQRMARGIHLPPHDPVRHRYVFNLSVFAAVVASAAAWIFRRGWGDLARPIVTRVGILFAFTLAGYFLKNLGLAGIEFENFHWLIVHGAATSLLLAVLVIALKERWLPALTAAAVTLAAVTIAVAAATRWSEAYRNPQAQLWTTTMLELRPVQPALAQLGPDDVIAGPAATNVALLYGQAGELFMSPYSVHGSLIDDREVHERHALNAWLMGDTEEVYRIESVPHGPFAAIDIPLPRWQPDAISSQRMAIFQSIETDNGAALLAKYRPDYLLLPSDHPPTRGGKWTLVVTSKRWALWRSSERA